MPSRLQIPLCDLREHAADRQQAMVSARKEVLDAHLPALDSGRQFACFVDRVQDGYHLHFVFRLLTLDGRSLALFFRDLTLAYQGQALDSTQSADYRDYVKRQETVRAEPSYQQSLQYWGERLKTLPPAPDLPIRDHEDIPHKSVFRRLQLTLTPDEVRQMTVQVRKLGATVNAVLCTLFADVLRMWARNPAFTLNLLISGRPADDPRFNETIGNFSSTLLLEVPLVEGGMRERVAALQTQLFREVEHKDVSGVEVIRHMSRPGSSLPAMPIVFASTLGLSKDGTMVSQADLGWRLVDSSMHTPQVWLDHQAYMEEGQLILNWDYVDGVFLPGVIDEMFEVYQTHLRQTLGLQTEGQAQALPPQAQQRPQLPPTALLARQAANRTTRPLPQGLLHDFFYEACCQSPRHTAIIAPDTQLSYSELLCHTTALASILRELEVRPNDLVAIVARRGWRQVAAAMAVVQSGGAYLPIAFDLPDTRKQWLAGQPGVKVVLCERDALGALTVTPATQLLVLEDVLPDVAPSQPMPLANVQGPQDLAYVIFTSGSTGQPKGVAIDHCGAVNTIQDVIARFGLDQTDRVIGLSAFNFDLSVYDIFGTLACGATLVLPPHSSTPSPSDWARCVQDHGVTVWNTVPALLEMQMEFSGAKAAEVLASLRLVMLSGDWIPLPLPSRLKTLVPDVKLVSLGGATEASIWSNYFEVDEVAPKWHSIPYGWPLSNQCFHVLDDTLSPTPTWAVGHLYIGGIGLAQGYYRDAERTDKSFIMHPATGERLYRTGDLGRYHADGCLEFLGRSDSQVKIHGHRIELGEIDAAMERCPFVRCSATLVKTTGDRQHQLLAFYVRDQAYIFQEDAAQLLRQHLSAQLPHYMVPGLLMEIDQMPVTANGKVDRVALLSRAAGLQVDKSQKVLPRNRMEAELSRLWQQLLGVEEPGIHDDFFELGGSSLLAVRLLNAIEATFGQTLPLASLLSQGTIALQAQRLLASSGSSAHDLKDSSGRKSVVNIRQDTIKPATKVLIAVHPVGGNVLCYRHLPGLVPEDVDILGIQSRGDGAARSVAEMAASYVDELRPHLQEAKQVHLLGWSMGGMLAQEMAGRMEALGIEVSALTMIDSWMGDPTAAPSDRLQGFELLKSFVGDLLQDQALHPDFDDLSLLPEAQWPTAIKAVLTDTSVGGLSTQDFNQLLIEHQANFNALIQHRPRATRIRPRQFRASRSQDFPHLVPFTSPVDTTKQDPKPELKVYLDDTHFSIVQGERMRHIVAATLGQGVFA